MDTDKVTDYAKTADYEKLQKEFDRQGQIAHQCEMLIEKRIYELSAGGLATSIAAFSLIGMDKLTHVWVTCVIWGLFSFCLIIHFISHQLALKKAYARQNFIKIKIKEKEPYDSEQLSFIYEHFDKPIVIINKITSFLLFLALLTTIFYISYSFLVL